jgi:4-amino-4-deoxy-L-arabinose transferase-like glycosyltransferase
MRETAALLPLTAVAAAVRFPGLDRQSIWLDEWDSVRLAVKPVAAIVVTPDGEPPLFGLLLHALIRLGAASDWWLRFPSAVAGTLAVPLLLLVGARLGRPRTGLVAAALLAIHPLAVWYSQEARAYAVTMLLALASTGCLVELLRGGRTSWAVAYALTTSLGFGFHYYFAFVVAAHALIALADAAATPARRRRWLGTALLTGVALALWLPGLRADAAAQAAPAASPGRRFPTRRSRSSGGSRWGRRCARSTPPRARARARGRRCAPTCPRRRWCSLSPRRSSRFPSRGGSSAQTAGCSC